MQKADICNDTTENFPLSGNIWNVYFLNLVHIVACILPRRTRHVAYRVERNRTFRQV